MPPEKRFDGLSHYAPFAVFILLTCIQDRGPWNWWPSAVYIFKTIATAGLLWHFRKSYTEISCKFHWSAVLSGLVVIWVWIAVDPFYPHMGKGGFDPTVIRDDAAR